MSYSILAINPGSTSTKIAVYRDQEEVFAKTLRHSAEVIAQYPKIIDQFSFREQVVREALQEAGIPFTFQAIIGRGGLLKPMPGGVYKVNPLMKAHLSEGIMGEHASNLGGLLAARLAAQCPQCEAFIADPVVVDEMQDVARYTGVPEIERISIFHALNQKAIGRHHAKEVGQRYEDLNLVIVHLGGGISVSAHRKGKVIDTNNALNGDGPIAPERAGSLPAFQLVQLSLSGQYTLDQIKKKLNGKGGMVAHLGTNSFMDVVQMEAAEAQLPANAPHPATKMVEAMAYSIAKYIGAMAVALRGAVDAVLFTGGIAHNQAFVDAIISQVAFIGPCYVYPGEDEMGALAQNAFAVLTGAQPLQEYVG